MRRSDNYELITFTSMSRFRSLVGPRLEMVGLLRSVGASSSFFRAPECSLQLPVF
jgi:hypothetical protein